MPALPYTNRVKGIGVDYILCSSQDAKGGNLECGVPVAAGFQPVNDRTWRGALVAGNSFQSYNGGASVATVGRGRFAS